MSHENLERGSAVNIILPSKPCLCSEVDFHVVDVHLPETVTQEAADGECSTSVHILAAVLAAFALNPELKMGMQTRDRAWNAGSGLPASILRRGSFLEELLAELKKLNDDPKVARLSGLAL